MRGWENELPIPSSPSKDSRGEESLNVTSLTGGKGVHLIADFADSPHNDFDNGGPYDSQCYCPFSVHTPPEIVRRQPDSGQAAI